MNNAPARIDGRAERSRKTRDAVVTAFMSLIDSGNVRPTARQVSEAAGVSLRSVFQHFADLESLLAEAADRQVARLRHVFVRIPADLPFAERLERFTAARASVLEEITPVRRAALLQAPFSAEVSRRLKWVRDLSRDEAERLFAGELIALGSAERTLAAPALHAAAEWYNWETLRQHEGLSPDEAQQVMSRTIRALLRKEED
jgi:AcrR family transcriptional regulator